MEFTLQDSLTMIGELTVKNTMFQLALEQKNAEIEQLKQHIHEIAPDDPLGQPPDESPVKLVDARGAEIS